MFLDIFNFAINGITLLVLIEISNKLSTIIDLNTPKDFKPPHISEHEIPLCKPKETINLIRSHQINNEDIGGDAILKQEEADSKSQNNNQWKTNLGLAWNEAKNNINSQNNNNQQPSQNDKFLLDQLKSLGIEQDSIRPPENKKDDIEKYLEIGRNKAKLSNGPVDFLYANQNGGYLTVGEVDNIRNNRENMLNTIEHMILFNYFNSLIGGLSLNDAKNKIKDVKGYTIQLQSRSVGLNSRTNNSKGGEDIYGHDNTNYSPTRVNICLVNGKVSVIGLF
jgi:hypothetical protein